MVINSNTAASSSARLLADSTNKLTKSLSRLSSGSKIISPEDDAGGLAVSMRFDAQDSRIGALMKNIGNEVSYAQTQDGFLNKIGKALDRMSELSTLALDPTKSSQDLDKYNAEFKNLIGYVNDISAKTFNGITLFDDAGTDTAHTVRIDENVATDFTRQAVALGGILDAIGTKGTPVVDLTDATAAGTALTAVQTQINTLATARANVGADISYLNNTISHMGVLKDNLSAANSRIKDVDVAEESTLFARYNILVQAGTAMVAQANVLPQSALRLLG